MFIHKLKTTQQWKGVEWSYKSAKNTIINKTYFLFFILYVFLMLY